MFAATPTPLAFEGKFLEYLKDLEPYHATTIASRSLHFVQFADGTSYLAAPTREPHKGDCLARNDPDLVSKEYEDGLKEYEQHPESLRQRAGPVVANRINTRRAIRERILPELGTIQPRWPG